MQRVFVAYSHQDQAALARVRVHLAPLVAQGLVDFWADTRIEPGAGWESEVDNALAQADVAILILSPDFLASTFIREHELPRVLAGHAEGRLRVLPVFLARSLADSLSYTVPGHGTALRLVDLQGFGAPDRPLMALSEPEREGEYHRLGQHVLALVQDTGTARAARGPILAASLEVSDAAKRRRSIRAASELAAANERLRQQIQADRAELDETRSSVEQQMAITQRIASNVQALERNQARMQGLVHDTERRLQDGLNALEMALAEQNGKLHGGQVDLATLRRNHQRHVEQVKHELADVQERMEKDLAEAEAHLKAAIHDVDRKLEQDQTDRGRQASDRMALATVDLAAAGESLSRVEAGVVALDLASEARQVKVRVALARTLMAQQNASAALTTAALCRADAESLEHEVRSRRIELDSTRVDMQRRLSLLQRQTGKEASEDVRACYAAECRRVQTTVAAALARLPGRYTAHRLLEFERREDHELIDQLESEVLDMVTSAPVVAEAAELRAAQFSEVADGLEKVYGEATAVEQSFAVPGDPKSDLVARMTLGSLHLQLRLSLDGTMRLDGHNGNSEWATAAHRIVQELQNRVVVERTQTDATTRQASRSEADPRGGPSSEGR